MMHVFFLLPRAATFNRATLSDRNKCYLLPENLSKRLLPRVFDSLTGGHLNRLAIIT